MKRKDFLGTLAKGAVGVAVGAVAVDQLVKEPEPQGVELYINGHKMEGWSEEDDAHWYEWRPLEEMRMCVRVEAGGAASNTSGVTVVDGVATNKHVIAWSA